MLSKYTILWVGFSASSSAILAIFMEIAIYAILALFIFGRLYSSFGRGGASSISGKIINLSGSKRPSDVTPALQIKPSRPSSSFAALLTRFAALSALLRSAVRIFGLLCSFALSASSFSLLHNLPWFFYIFFILCISRNRII